MEKAIQGKKIKLMFRLTRERATTAAKLLALEISHEYKSETKKIVSAVEMNINENIFSIFKSEISKMENSKKAFDKVKILW